jgi:two-component system chemotaxis sensor kinase CheA
MDELLTEFIAETREMLDALGGQLVAWEEAPSDRSKLDEIFRFVHTVKGNSGFFDLPRIEALSHAAEDVLAAVRDGRRIADVSLISAVLAAVDRIGALVGALETGEAVPEDDEELVAALSGEKATDARPSQPELRAGVRSVRVSIELLDRVMNGISDAVLARNELSRRMREAGADAAVESAFERVSACIAEIRDAFVRTRMQRIDTLFAALPRIVRDLSAELGREVRLELDGGEVELDREMVETLRDPLTHIVRNAIDHGIEPPAARARAGKPAAGFLRVSARQAGNQILIEVADDGRGVDGEALARRAVAAGLLPREAAQRLSPAQKTALIFEPGLSTASQVTAVSGRGVGMDVVRTNVERIGGVAEAESRNGEGLRLVIRVPLTLTIIPALTVSAGGGTYAIPRGAIEEILRANSDSVRIEQVGGAAVASVRGQRLPLVTLSTLLGREAVAPEGSETLVLLRPAGGSAYALAVDAVHDHAELVVKPAAPPVMAAGLYAGTTLADDGRPILLLDAAGLAACAGLDLKSDESGSAEPTEEEVGREEVQMLLFRTLEGARRAVRLAVVERIEDVESAAVARTGGRLRVAIGDRLVPLAGCTEPPEGRLRIFRLSDGEAEIAYGFGEVIDIVSAPIDLQPAAAPGEVAGVALIGGEQVEMLDPFWLFAVHGASAEPALRQVCSLSPGDPWMDTILRPLIESLGYEVVTDGPSDIRIVADDAEDPGEAGGRVIRLRARPDSAGRRDRSIYRYDRAALLAALAAGGSHG